VVNPVDEAELVFIPAGEFTMGSNESDPYFWGAEAPQHVVILDEFWIYKTEVTNRMYALCQEAKSCPRPAQVHSVITDSYYGNPAYDNYPVIYVTYVDAVSYCSWAGGRLPTEAEWEKAARGTDRRLFPWGDDDPSGDLANICDRLCTQGAKREAAVDDGFPGPAPVGSFPAGVSPYGVLDMAGNVWEWVFDWFSPAYYNVSPMENPLGPAAGVTRGIRGGGWDTPNSGVRVVVRTSLTPTKSLNGLGFRCVIDEP
jgi:formylglycine-generating enzyme required for sulfatase activity